MPNTEEKKYFSKLDGYNIFQPAIITDADVEIKPRCYRPGSKNVKNLINVLRERSLSYTDEKGRHDYVPVFRSTAQASSIVAFRYVNTEAYNKNIESMHRIFVEVYSKIPSKNSELFFDSKKLGGFDEDRHRKISMTDVGGVEIIDDSLLSSDDVSSTNPSMFVRFPFINMKKIMSFIEMISSRSSVVTYKIANICDNYRIQSDEIIDGRIIQAEEVIISPDSFTTENLVIRGRIENDGKPKGMPVRVRFDHGMFVMETVETDMVNQIRYGCDSKLSCSKCPKESCMKNGTVCSWHVDKTRKKSVMACRMVFSRESFLNIITKMIFFSNGTESLEIGREVT